MLLIPAMDVGLRREVTAGMDLARPPKVTNQ